MQTPPSTHRVGLKLRDLLGLARAKVVHPDDVVRASCSQEHATWTNTRVKASVNND